MHDNSGYNNKDQGSANKSRNDNTISTFETQNKEQVTKYPNFLLLYLPKLNSWLKSNKLHLPT